MLPVAEQTDPPLTTVRQDIEGMGRLMARLLLRGLDRRAADATDFDAARTPTAAPPGVVLPTTLVHRSTA